ncbi:cell division protein FtsK [Kribbella antibiotica]|uniref:Cell division protein FtsK n=1 Tax=Kribbella antibiotica TaxID=190195 RepID=A0A4R4Z6G7_9ACTN|nr:cell division protein FtsK [Kribbella antibiotica]TDD53758.1 cell division protein FtsK [Kribbella antibiotica]
MPNEPLRLSRRVALQSTAIATGAVLMSGVLAGCKDDQAGSGTPGAVDPGSGKTVPENTPTVDPAVVAALSSAAGVVSSLAAQYTLVGTKYPALKPKLAAAAKFHAGHLAKLQETAGVTVPKAPPVPGTGSASGALASLAQQEKAASIAHAAAAAKVSGPAARLLAMIAASEVQLGSTLVPTKKAASS